MAQKFEVATFFKEDYPGYGAYDLTRKCSSYVDGLKISMRKILYTFIEKYPNTKDKIKTETIANYCAAFTNYLHGAANLCGVCDTLAQSFVGANNYPLLNGNSGGFGTRIKPECAAPRYTKIALSDLFKKMIDKNDMAIIDKQFFEGEYIEPKFFVPVFPILLLNGSSGISIGFGQDIYPRNPTEVTEYIKKKLSGVDKPRCELLPWFRGFTGKIEKNATTGFAECFGVITKNNMTSYTITEIPIGVEYDKYIEYLDKLIDNGTIQDYKNKSDTKLETICFELKTTREFTKKYDGRKLYEILHLVKSLPETLCCIDENNRIREFNSIQEILDAFIDIRLKYYDKRKSWLLSTIKQNLEELVSKYVFVKSIVDKKLVVSNKKKDDIVKHLEKMDKVIKVDGNYDYLLRMPIHSLTAEKLEELKKQILDAKDLFKTTKETTIQQMWTNDLHELKKLF